MDFNFTFNDLQKKLQVVSIHWQLKKQVSRLYKNYKKGKLTWDNRKQLGDMLQKYNIADSRFDDFDDFDDSFDAQVNYYLVK